MDNRTLLTQLDACRPGTDDVHDDGKHAAELSPLAERLASDDRAADLHRRVQAADRAIAAALRDVPVPEGLADRISAALKAARLGDVELESPISDCRSQIGDTSVRNPQSAIRNLRPSPWRVVTVLSVAAACLAFWFIHLQQPTSVSVEEIAAEVRAVYESDVAAADAEWTTQDSNVAHFEVPDFIQAGYRTVYRSRSLTVGGYDAVALDLLGPVPQNLPPPVLLLFPKRVTLIVIDRTVQGLSHLPPIEPHNTQGRCLGVWQSKHAVYALVVEGSEDQYRRVLDQTPVARLTFRNPRSETTL